MTMTLAKTSLLLLLAAAFASSAADVTTKDIVIDRIAAPAAGAVGPAVGDAMAVSVLLESPYGDLAPRSTSTAFKTGDRFRIKLLASRDAKVSLYNTNPQGQFQPTPIWQGNVKVGQETISPRLRLDGNSGTDLLHIVLEPALTPPEVSAWVGRRIGKEAADASKDIHLDSQDTQAGTYLLNGSGQGLVTTVRIVHY